MSPVQRSPKHLSELKQEASPSCLLPCVRTVQLWSCFLSGCKAAATALPFWQFELPSAGNSPKTCKCQESLCPNSTPMHW